MPNSDLDAIDRHILEVLQVDGRLSVVELADKVGLSPSPCLRRVKRLEAEGHIAGYRASLSRERIGLGLTVFVGVKVDGHRDENATALQQAIKAMPEVVSAHLVSGEADFLLEVVMPDLKHYEEFLVGRLLKLPMIKDIRSNFAIRTVKLDAALPLGHLAPPVPARKEARKPVKPARQR
ncbi:Lrp/AsnC family transcriptional regulator [Hypericibacter sp.]|uniref:Lrp/AsnC family transcriptional regulator n=1 Tax=Hypericibacter sp. TaxID=2705401 RepID=UPI003D6D0698